MNAEFRNITVYTIRIQDSADHVDNLAHPVAEPSLYMAIDVGVKMLQTLLTGCVHSSLSLPVPVDSAMRPSRPPEVKARPLDEGQSHLSAEPGMPYGPAN
jgi:hypothetical protein